MKKYIWKGVGLLVIAFLCYVAIWNIMNPKPLDFEWQVGEQILARIDQGNLSLIDWVLAIIGLIIVGLWICFLLPVIELFILAGSLLAWIALSAVNLVRSATGHRPVAFDPFRLFRDMIGARYRRP